MQSLEERRHIRVFGHYPITESEKLKLEELGIIGKLTKKDIEQQRLVAKHDYAKRLYEGAKIALEKEKNSELNSDIKSEER